MTSAVLVAGCGGGDDPVGATDDAAAEVAGYPVR